MGGDAERGINMMREKVFTKTADGVRMKWKRGEEGDGVKDEGDGRSEGAGEKAGRAAGKRKCILSSKEIT